MRESWAGGGGEDRRSGAPYPAVEEGSEWQLQQQKGESRSVWWVQYGKG